MAACEIKGGGGVLGSDAVNVHRSSEDRPRAEEMPAGAQQP